MDLRQGEEASAFAGPASKRRQGRQAFAAAIFQAGGLRHHRRLVRGLADQAAKGLLRLFAVEFGQTRRHFPAQRLEFIDAERQGHPPRRAEEICRHRPGITGNVGEEQRLAAAGAFRHPIGHGGDLLIGLHWCFDPVEIALPGKPLQKLT